LYHVSNHSVIKKREQIYREEGPEGLYADQRRRQNNERSTNKIVQAGRKRFDSRKRAELTVPNETLPEMLKEKGIRQSMSRKGSGWDNALIENSFCILKTESLYLQLYFHGAL